MTPVLIRMDGGISETAVLNLVEGTDDLSAVRVLDDHTVKADIARLQPCVVILDAEAAVAKSAQVLDLLETLPQLRILVVHAESNVVEVFNKHEVTLQQASDLIEVIHQSWPSPSPIRP